MARFLKDLTVMEAPARQSGAVGEPGGDRRGPADRRRRPTPFLRLSGPRRRRGFRRAGEGRNLYTDCLLPRAAFLAILIVALSALDAAFTLLHLESGAREMNPLMEGALHAGLMVFIGIKTVGTGIGAAVLSIHQHFRLSWVALHCLALGYGGLLAYHLLLCL